MALNEQRNVDGLPPRSLCNNVEYRLPIRYVPLSFRFVSTATRPRWKIYRAAICGETRAPFSWRDATEKFRITGSERRAKTRPRWKHFSRQMSRDGERFATTRPLPCPPLNKFTFGRGDKCSPIAKLLRIRLAGSWRKPAVFSTTCRCTVLLG